MSDETRSGVGSGSRPTPSDEEILQGWHLYAARQPGSVGELLALLRLSQGQSAEQQRIELDIPASAFSRLQSLRAPRPDTFTSDALRIAEACQVGQPFALVQALLIARSLRNQIMYGRSTVEAETPEREGYEAAFDAIDSLDGGSGGEDED